MVVVVRWYHSKPSRERGLSPSGLVVREGKGRGQVVKGRDRRRFEREERRGEEIRIPDGLSSG